MTTQNSMSPCSSLLTRMQGRSPTDEKQTPLPPYPYAKDHVPDNTGSSLVTKPRSAIRRLLAFGVGGSPKTAERFTSAKRRWSFITRFMPSGPDNFYLSATPETPGNSTEHSRFFNVELPLQFEMMSICDTDCQITCLQGSPSSEPQIAMAVHGTTLPYPNPMILPVTANRDCTQIVYSHDLSADSHQIYPAVGFFAIHNEISVDQSHHSDMDLDTEMDNVDNAMDVDYNPIVVNDILLPPTALPVIPYAGLPELPFSSQLISNANGSHDRHIDNGICDPFYSTPSQYHILPDRNEVGDGLPDTEDDDGVSAPLDNVPRRPSLETPSALVLEENEAGGLGTPQQASLIHRQHQPVVYEHEPDADTDCGTEDEAEPRKPFKREATEPLEEGEDKPPVLFLRFDQGVSTDLLEDSFSTSALPSRQIAPSTKYDDHGLQSSLPETTPILGEEQEKSLAVLHAEAERLLDSLEHKLCSPPQISRQITLSATDDEEFAKPFECEATQPLKDGGDQTPTVFLSYEQRTDTCTSQQCLSSTIDKNHPEPFKRESTEPLDEGENQAPVVFPSYEQRIAAGCLGDDNVDALIPIPNSADEPDQSFVREPTEPLEEDSEGKPPTAPSTPSNQIVHFASIPSQQEPRASYSIPHTNSQLVFNKHGRPARPLSREKLKRTLGGAPCDLSSLASTTPWPLSGDGAGYDGDEREDRTDPSKKARRDTSKVPADRGGNKQVRFGGSRRVHFHNAVARFAARSRGPILRSTGNETQLSASPLNSISFIIPSSGAVGAASKPFSPLPPVSLSCTKSQSSKNSLITQLVEMTTESDSDVKSLRKPAYLLVDELDHKHRRTLHHPPTEAAGGGVVRHARRSHRENWIHAHTRRGCLTDNSSLRFLGKSKKHKRKGPLSGIGVRFKLPDIEPVGA
ncbi:hypothetical protein EDC04DRAFT_1389436 [Pisolithus marmoratus]|nr:hypothetical protein EDC04DRAFT_1389436 [Pisolithus marmoratus]